MYKVIRIEDKLHLIKLETIFEKLNHLCLSLKIRLEEKKRLESEKTDLLDNVIEFFLNYSEELNIQINNSMVGDTIFINKSTKNMLKKIVEFYEAEIKDKPSNIIEKEKKECEELLSYI